VSMIYARFIVRHATPTAATLSYIVIIPPVSFPSHRR